MSNSNVPAVTSPAAARSGWAIVPGSPLALHIESCVALCKIPALTVNSISITTDTDTDDQCKLPENTQVTLPFACSPAKVC